MSDDQKFDAIKPRTIQQPADLELYNDILQNNAEQIKETAKDAVDRARILGEIVQSSKGSVSETNSTNQQQQVTE